MHERRGKHRHRSARAAESGPGLVSRPTARHCCRRELRLLALLVAPAAVAGGPAAAEDLSSTVRAVYGGSTRPATVALMEAALAAITHEASLQYSMTIEPPDRAVQSFRTGLYSVEVGRFENFGELVPGAHRIDTPILTVLYVTLGRNPGIRPKSWQELAALSVAYVRGFKRVEQQLSLVPSVRREVANSPDACVAMAALGRVDVCALPVLLVAPVPEPPAGVTLYESLLDRANLYLWTGPEHGLLAKRLNQAAAALELRGELDRLLGPNRER